jgi:hypothetical protein
MRVPFKTESDAFRVAVALGLLVGAAVLVGLLASRAYGVVVFAALAASMIIPTLVAIALLAADVLGFGTLMGLEHVAMLLGMLVAMLLRLDEYTGHAHHGHDVVAA